MGIDDVGTEAGKTFNKLDLLIIKYSKYKLIVDYYTAVRTSVFQ